MKNVTKNQLLNEKFINEKIDEYDQQISQKLYQSISNKFKQRILKNYSSYQSITFEVLDEMLDKSDFKELCFSDLSFLMSKNESFWINDLIKSFEGMIDFKELKKYEDSIQNKGKNNDDNTRGIRS